MSEVKLWEANGDFISSHRLTELKAVYRDAMVFVEVRYWSSFGNDNRRVVGLSTDPQIEEVSLPTGITEMSIQIDGNVDFIWETYVRNGDVFPFMSALAQWIETLLVRHSFRS